jgi:methylmalonyl-CoA mutase C-terminal domain/subunit
MNMEAPKIRVLISKVGLDCHDRGARVLARMLRDAGMEVIYLGLFQDPERIVKTAVEEDVHVVGISCMCNEHAVFMPEVAGLLYPATQRRGRGLPLLLAGGVIPRNDIETLEKMGVDAVFPAGSMVDDIVHYIRQEVSQRSTMRRSVTKQKGTKH